MEVEKDTRKYIKVLDYMIKHIEEQPYRDALIAAHNRLTRDITEFRPIRRKPEEWPYCSTCGRPYAYRETNNEYVHEIYPGCGCGAGIRWEMHRPAKMWNETNLEVQ